METQAHQAIDMWPLYLHGVFMFVAFGVFSTLSVMFGQFGKYWTSKWLDQHLTTQLISFLLSIVGIIFAFPTVRTTIRLSSS